MKDARIGIVNRTKEILSKNGWKLSKVAGTKEWYGYYINNLPRQFESLWIGMLNCPEAKGIFVAVNPANMNSGMKLIQDGFQSFPLWGPAWWFIKRLISNKNITMLKRKPLEEMDKVLGILLANIYPFSV